MSLIKCLCGATFERRKEKRCPVCGLLIHLRRRDGSNVDGARSCFETFAELEAERGRVAVRHPGATELNLYYYSPERRGAERYGWRTWPSSVTEEQRARLLELQALDDELPVEEAAKLVYNVKTGERGVSRFRLWQMITKGQVEAVRRGRAYFVTRRALAALDGRSDGRPANETGD